VSRLTKIACAALVLAASTGCVYRSLTIRTEPPGAKLYVNDELKGETPISYDFLWYGWHRIILRKDGYERVEDRRRLRAPFYLWIPFDLGFELLPLPVRDSRTWSYTLTPTETLPEPQPPSLDPARDGALSGVEGSPALEPTSKKEPDGTR